MQLIVVIVVVNKSFWDVHAVVGGKITGCIDFPLARVKKPIKTEEGPVYNLEEIT